MTSNLYRQINDYNFLVAISSKLQVTIPLGMHNNLPVAVSLLARHGGDQLLLNLVHTIYGTLKEQVSSVEKLSD